MNDFEIAVVSLFGLESFTAREIRRLGYETTEITDGRICFSGNEEAVARANMNIRTGERVLIKIAEFEAETFEDLFEGVKAADWSRWLNKNASFPVKGYSLKSTLASVSSCQSIIKKAIAVKMSEIYGCETLPEDGDLYQIQFSIYKNKVTIMLDTSGTPLHKRGYRQTSNLAPLRETMAAAMVMLSYWKYEYPLFDPFCGSGTIPIEAAMFKNNIAPGINRTFAAENFSFIDRKYWIDARDEAKSNERRLPLQIYASDISEEYALLTKANAELAGVGDVINVTAQNALSLEPKEDYGTIICNPPYGERLGEIKDCERLYKRLGKKWNTLDTRSFYILTNHEEFEKLFGKRANKKRKLYNGMIKCNLYQYFGKKPE